MTDPNNPMQEMQEMFIEEARPMLAELESLFLSLESGSQAADVDFMDRIFRLAHNLKGSAAAVGLEHFATLCHGIEDVYLWNLQELVARAIEARYPDALARGPGAAY